MSAPRVLFYVQHLLGIGHLKRAGTLARAMAAAGLDVTLVSGGENVPVFDAGGIDFVQLDPVRAIDRGFAGLVDARGEAVGEDLKAARRDRLLRVFHETRPAVVVIELFPFGRRQLRFELMPLIEAARAARPRPKIVSSVRDVLVEKNKPHRDREMVDVAATYFDHILVHGDPRFIPFERTFAPARRIAGMISYTGYVVDHAEIDAVRDCQRGDEVLVSSGGGATGEKLLRTALAVRAASPLAASPWRLLAGHNMPDDAFKALGEAAKGDGGGVIVERARGDFVSLLRRCRLSISQGGYNTVMEILATRTPAVIVPYAGGHETEQTLRGRLLAERGLLQSVDEDRLTEAALIAAIEAATRAPPPGGVDIDMNGARTAAGLVADWAAPNI